MVPGLLSTGVSVTGAEERWGQGREEEGLGRELGTGLCHGTRLPGVWSAC